MIGELPDDLAGVFVRNGSNPKFAPPGRYHWFDGDGMLHALHFENGTAVYRNRYVAHRGARGGDRPRARRSGRGINERPDFSHPGGPFKDTANTDLVFHAGRLLALWWLGGPCYEVDAAVARDRRPVRLRRHAARASPRTRSSTR